MHEGLLIATTLVDLLALISALWLGFYILTRSPRSVISWLAALTMGAMACWFLYEALALRLPTRGILIWLRQMVDLALPLWFHLTLRLRLLEGNPLPRTIFTHRLALLLFYGAAVAHIIVVRLLFLEQTEIDGTPPLYLGQRPTAVGYGLFVSFLCSMGALSINNLVQGWRQVRNVQLKGQFAFLLLATGLAYLGALYVSIGLWLRLALPVLPGNAAMGAGIILLGYTVAHYNALIEGRTIERDALYGLGGAVLVTTFYLAVCFALYLNGQASFLAGVVLLVCVIASHSLYDGGRALLDRLFYHGRLRQLRTNLRVLAQEVGAGHTLAEQLSVILNALRRILQSQQGFIAVQRAHGFVIEATSVRTRLGETFPTATLAAAEIQDLEQTPRADLPGMALLVPLTTRTVQVGALVLGPRRSGQPYHPEDWDLLETLADQIASVIHTARQQAEGERAIAQLVDEFRERERSLEHQVQQLLATQTVETPANELSTQEFVSLVEEVLRHLHDYPYLGEHTLAHLQVVQRHLANPASSVVTHLDRGKALSEILLQALHKLRPAGKTPGRQEMPAQEWYPFLILHDAYVQGELNRDIMSRLYISEGTFNRTRRRALRGVALALQEMERAA